jgi:hypothetical protein
MLHVTLNFDDHRLIDSVFESKLNSISLIPMVEDVMQIEKTNMEANRVLNNDVEYMINEYRISQCEILLSLLRMNRSDRVLDRIL